MELMIDLWERFILIAGIFLVIFGGLLLTMTCIATSNPKGWTPSLVSLAIGEGSITFLGITFIALYVKEQIVGYLVSRKYR